MVRTGQSCESWEGRWQGNAREKKEWLYSVSGLELIWHRHAYMSYRKSYVQIPKFTIAICTNLKYTISNVTCDSYWIAEDNVIKKYLETDGPTQQNVVLK